MHLNPKNWVYAKTNAGMPWIGSIAIKKEEGIEQRKEK